MLKEKPLNNFYGELTYENIQGDELKEKGMFNEKALLSGIGIRILTGLFTAIGEF